MAVDGQYTINGYTALMAIEGNLEAYDPYSAPIELKRESELTNEQKGKQKENKRRTR